MTVNLALAVVAGLFTWGMLELLGVDLAVPLAILVAIFDLVPLIGLTIGGLVVAVVAALHSFPDAMLIWLAAFIAYQQLQDRVVQPLLYGRAVKVNPLIAILVLFAGAQISGILGRCWRFPSLPRSRSSSRCTRAGIRLRIRVRRAPKRLPDVPHRGHVAALEHLPVLEPLPGSFPLLLAAIEEPRPR